MHISPVSFGKTVRVQNKNLAYKIADVVNGSYSEPVDKSFKKQVKKIFDDVKPSVSWDEKATVWQVEDDAFFVLSGKEAKESMEYRAEFEDSLEWAGQYYGSGELLDASAEEYGKTLADKIKSLVERTKESYTLTAQNFGDNKISLKKSYK
ncbi:hypothetical protein IJ425_00870 [bacterium]|nr:hypothetical protein [bacterium]